MFDISETQLGLRELGLGELRVSIDLSLGELSLRELNLRQLSLSWPRHAEGVVASESITRARGCCF